MRKNYGINNYLFSGKTIYRYILICNFFLWYIVYRVKFLFIKIYDGDDFDKYIRGFIFKERFSGV